MSDLFKGCLLACDLDGTLISGDKIPERNTEKIKDFIEKGGEFALATGRSADAVSMAQRALHHLQFGVMLNGGAIYDYKNKKVLYEVNLPEEDKIIAKAVSENLPEIGIEIHTADETYTLVNSKEVEDHQLYEEIKAINVDFETALRYNWCKVLYILNHESDIEPIQKIANSFSHNSRFVKTVATIYGRKRDYFEQIPKNCSKAEGLEILCRLRNVKKGNLFAIGDYNNDVEMLKSADISASVYESPDDVKQCSTIVTGPAKNGAVADFIEYLIKERKKKNGN
jgi:Cof subfamily protein (haloacid dehalogenase superfamily)